MLSAQLKTGTEIVGSKKCSVLWLLLLWWWVGGVWHVSVYMAMEVWAMWRGWRRLEGLHVEIYRVHQWHDTLIARVSKTTGRQGVRGVAQRVCGRCQDTLMCAASYFSTVM